MSDVRHPDEQAFIARAKDVLDRAADELDAATARKLQRARAAALERRSRWSRRAAWVAGLAAASVAALALWLWTGQPGPERQAAVPLEDFELVTSVENIELVEDLDFYHWLADGDTAG
jgi:ferric-dicitrate binding protein FerR (iron transport regulator)